MPYRFLAKSAAHALNLLACLALLSAPAQAQETANEPMTPQQVEVVQTSSGTGFPWGLLGLFGLLGLARRRPAKVVYLPAETGHDATDTTFVEPTNAPEPENEDGLDGGLVENDLLEEDLLEEALEPDEALTHTESSHTFRIVPNREHASYADETEWSENEPGEAEARFPRRIRRR